MTTTTLPAGITIEGASRLPGGRYGVMLLGPGGWWQQEHDGDGLRVGCLWEPCAEVIWIDPAELSRIADA